MRKLIIIGSGPAGYTAGIYSGRAQLKPLILAGETHGGQLMNTTVIENWPGADEGINGPDLMMRIRQQAQKFGAEILDKKVSQVDFKQRPFKVWAGNLEYQAEAVIIATGSESLMLGVPRTKELLGRGVATCAVCDAPFYKDKVVLVVGGGDAACEEALALTKFAKQVYMIVRRDQLRASKIMAERVKKQPKIKIIWNSQVTKIIGQNKVEAVVINNQETIKTDGVFLAIGHTPATGIFKGQLELDEKGYIKTIKQYPYLSRGNQSGSGRGLTMTSVEGVFAAGDVVDSRYRQAVTAAGMGCMAALDAEKWLEEKYE